MRDLVLGLLSDLPRKNCWSAGAGAKGAARLEIYETDPAVEPDMTKWTTQLAFRLRTGS
jgi:hypothetical protein